MNPADTSRRTVLRSLTALGVGATVALAGCSGGSGESGSTGTESTSDTSSSDGSNGGGSSDPYGGWFGDATGGAAKNYDGTTVDKTGQDTVTVEVGANGNGGTFAFAPPAVKIDSGTKVEFKWVSDTHNVVVQSQPSGANWQGESKIENEGHTYSDTFQTTGVYTYYCSPHLSLGMKGAFQVV